MKPSTCGSQPKNTVKPWSTLVADAEEHHLISPLAQPRGGRSRFPLGRCGSSLRARRADSSPRLHAEKRENPDDQTLESSRVPDRRAQPPQRREPGRPALLGAAVRPAPSRRDRRTATGSTRSSTTSARSRCRRGSRAGRRACGGGRAGEGRRSAGSAPPSRAEPPRCSARLNARARPPTTAPRPQRVLERALLNLGLAQTIQLVVMPCLRDVGRRWECGEISVAEEHFATGVIRRRLVTDRRGLGRGR